jgi:hypothetical protein
VTSLGAQLVAEVEVEVLPPQASSWRPVDLSDAVNGVDVAPPVVLARTDGPRLLYAGRTHMAFGASESLKTWFAISAASSVLADGGRVLWVDFEDDERGIVARLKSLGVPVEAILERFTYLRPDEPLCDRYGSEVLGGLELLAVTESPFELAVVDGVTEAMTTEGLDPMSNTDAATWQRRLPKLLADRTSAAVLVIDHVPKSSDGPTRFSIGGQHKLASLTGAAFRFDVTRPLSRAVTDPVEASVNVTVTKDRPGHVRAHAVGDRVAIMAVTAYPDGGVTIQLQPPIGGPSTPDAALVMRIATFLDQYEGASKTTIETDVEGRAVAIRDALRWMAAPERAWVRIERVGQSHRHHLTDDGRKELLS